MNTIEEIREIALSEEYINAGVGTTYRFGNKSKQNKIDFNKKTDKELKYYKELYNEGIEKYKLIIDEIEDVLRSRKV